MLDMLETRVSWRHRRAMEALLRSSPRLSRKLLDPHAAHLLVDPKTYWKGPVFELLERLLAEGDQKHVEAWAWLLVMEGKQNPPPMDLIHSYWLDFKGIQSNHVHPWKASRAKVPFVREGQKGLLRRFDPLTHQILALGGYLHHSRWEEYKRKRRVKLVEGGIYW